MSELEIATANHIHVMEQLDAAKRTASGGVEYWHARDLMRVLGYTTWQNFQAAIRRATDAMRETGVDPSHQVMQTHRPITGGKGAVQIAEDFFVTRGAAYLIAMNGDPTKPEVAAAQAYFAEQARENELAKQEAADVLATMGLTVSDAVRLMLTKIAREKSLPFELWQPNAETVAAMQEARSGKLQSFDSVDDLMASLNAKD